MYTIGQVSEMFRLPISTLRYITEADGLLPYLDDRLRELEFGAMFPPGWQPPGPGGGPPPGDDIRARQWIDRDLAAPEGESLNQCCQRMTEAISEFVRANPGKKILVTAGPTREAIDPVRFITNHSSGKMGYAIARAAALRGAEVTLVSGPVSLTPPPGVRLVPITSAHDLFCAVTAVSEEQDIIIKAAAVADYRPVTVSDEKIKKADDDLSLSLARTEDTLQYLGDHKPEGQILCGFAMETSDLENRARAKLKKKNLDMIAANNVKVAGAGFGTDTNVVTFITADSTEQLEIMSKESVAMKLLDRLAALSER